jgi:zinc protease
MNFKIYSKKFALFAIFLFFITLNASAQTINFPAPREEKLLNGLRIFAWTDAQAAKVSVKLRVHSGAAFDLQGKEGTMLLLGEILFPSDAARAFFTEDLNGSFEIAGDYDYIQINLSGDADKILEILESLAGAVQNPVIDKETTAAVKQAHLAKLQELEKNPAYIADLAVRKRLLGNYPYGRPALGTTESIGKLDFADILFAKQKYLTADNATLAVSGNVKPEFVFRAAKRFFGGWMKADKKIPSTFTAPDAPDTKTFLTKTEIENTSELRYALRGLARNDKDFAASQILTRILQNRLNQSGTIRHETHVLPGIVVFELPQWNIGKIRFDGDKVSLPGNTFTLVADLMKKNVEQSEFDKAKADFLAEFGKQNATDFWLDNHTYKLMPVKDETQKASSAALADVQRVLENWRKEAVATSLVVTAPK